MIEVSEITDRLAMFGISLNEDNSFIEFEINKWVQYSLNFMNRDDLPDEVKPKVIDKICAQLLLFKLNLGELEDFDYSVGVSEITEGDTTVKYNHDGYENINEVRFQKALNLLDTTLVSWLVHFRKVKWWLELI